MFEKKFDRWLSDYKINSLSGVAFDVGVTIKDLNGSPNADGVKTIEKYIRDFSSYWDGVYSKFIEFNSKYSSEEIKKSINPKIFMYAPALVGATTYDLMVLFELKSDVIQHQNCTFCYSDGKLVLSEQHV
ncbi:hypothetical protein D0C16_12905 [Cellvibrio sp. KY-GH-1]|uniref:hypothetical protein n=1 Tax=Cellvibrio sp. KY-GH-1 TaxID=2303332 RepID=UPI00124572E0|nr:hypothetical protein [Cellvibrio sp. KY-GH-1]QEY16790.1 hypothetical protein D0C16_12905 [Cellvibrio sp. KY-GH-1]